MLSADPEKGTHRQNALRIRESRGETQLFSLLTTTPLPPSPLLGRHLYTSSSS